jgi:O-antigen/teichoic acid export membrane protein
LDNSLINISRYINKKLAELYSKKIIRNILTNYSALIINGMISLLIMPFYISQLGPSEWGLLSFCITIQGLLLLVDAGISQILSPKIAGTKKLSDKIIFYKTAIKLYLFVSIPIVVFGEIFTKDIIHILFNKEFLDTEYFGWLFRLALLQFLLQLLNNASYSYWVGADKQHTANKRQITFAFLKHISAVWILFFDPKAFLYQIPFVFFSIIELIFNYAKITNNSKKYTKGSAPIFIVFEGAQWISLAAIIGMLANQVDRLYLARYLSIADYGIYIAISTLAMMFMSLNGPIYKAILPSMINFDLSLNKLHKLFLICLGLSFFPCLIIIFLSKIILTYWLKNQYISEDIIFTFVFFMMGVALNSLNSIAYMLFIKHKLFKRLVLLNLSILLVEVLVVKFLFPILALMSGALAFFVGMLIQFLYGLYYLSSYSYDKKKI